MGYPRIQYNNINVDFDVHLNDCSPGRIETAFENEAASGVIETLRFFERFSIRARKERLDADIVDRLEEWYRYVKDGSSFKFWWDRNLGMYVPFEGQTLITNDELAGTFARTDAAYYQNPHTGLVTSVAAATPRFESGKFGDGLLVEGASTNILTRSEEFDHADWVKTNVTVNANTTDTKDPMGTNTADKLTASAANGTVKQDTATAINTDDGVFSIWLKAKSQSTNNVTIKIRDLHLVSLDVTVTPEWQRFDVSYDNAGADANNWGVTIELNNNGDVIYAWGAQLEVGAHRRFPTGYIKTTAAAATRNDESCYWDITDDLEVGYLKGSVGFWFRNPWLYNEGGGGGGDPQRVLLQIVDSGGNPFLTMRRYTASELQAILHLVDGTVLGVASHTLTELAVNTWHHLVATYDATISDGIKLYLDGSLVGTSTNNPGLPAIPDKVYIGSDDTPANHADCKFDELLTRKDILTAEAIGLIYNSGKGLGYRRNYFLALILEEKAFNPVLHRGGNVYDFDLVAKEEMT